MKYEKPELCEAAAALQGIKGQNKTDSMHNDSVTLIPPAVTTGAYEADE